MYYEINVSLNGRHFFATSEHSVQDAYKAESLYKVFLKKFPESEGYRVTVTKWETKGHQTDFAPMI